MALDDHQARQRADRIEDLLEQAESLPDPVRSTTLELLQTLLELYGEGLARMVETAEQDGADPLRKQWVSDDVVSYLLLLHGLHPLDPSTRIQRALDGVRGKLEGAEAELLEVEEGTVRLQLSGAGDAKSSTTELRTILQDAVSDVVPEFERIEIREAAAAATLISVDNLMQRTGSVGNGGPAVKG